MGVGVGCGGVEMLNKNHEICFFFFGVKEQTELMQEWCNYTIKQKQKNNNQKMLGKVNYECIMHKTFTL